ncbi:Ima1 N-terminal domain-containing protein [Phaeosphaeriaceae sp. PMI808]|nr:Ima1 N-terminal domain-containing protein [Phaeosphaeriaceae sp. PMI808]
MPLLRRRIRCHYCNQQSRDGIPNTTRQYLCPQCDAVNYLDERGSITDPPTESIAIAPSTSFRYSRSPSPAMYTPVESPFCDTCQRNQTMLQKLIAEYLPDEDDPEYAKYEAAFDAYRAELDERYPQVCKDCESRVNAQIRNAGYAAKADHLRRIMERSEQKKRTVQTSRQAWTLKLIVLAKWTYITSFAIQIIWHVLGYMMAVDDDVIPIMGKPSWEVCMRQAIHVRQVDKACLLSPVVLKVVLCALFADALTLWWNPRLKEKTNSITGQMRGLKSLWVIRGAAFVLRAVSIYYWQHTTINNTTLTSFHNTHIYMLFVLTLSFVLTWKTVRITYQSPSSFQRSVQDTLTSTPNTPEKGRRSSYRPAHPQANAFDTMAHGFTTSFSDTLDAPACPPSPTLSTSSYTTYATDATTPHGYKSMRGDDMDWTPTQRKFAPVQPNIHPSPWGQDQASPTRFTTPQEPHSLFSKPDPNPFRHKVPAAPKAPAQQHADEKARGGVGETKGLDGFGVPKHIKRDAELFASPKLKYDYYGTMKDTGLEDRFEETFNDFFSK